MYCVYVHTFPDGKVYVGQTKNADNRWHNGENYKNNLDMYEAIQQYGWENIKHDIICLVETREEALNLEKMYIVLLNAENPQYGYNKTSVKKDLEKQYFRKEAYALDGNIDWTNEEELKNIFKKRKIPRSVANTLIDEYIYNARDREIYKRNRLDGMTYLELANKYCLSDRHIKRIIRNCDEAIMSIL